jgi:hypothetical protein
MLVDPPPRVNQPNGSPFVVRRPPFGALPPAAQRSLDPLTAAPARADDS